MPSKSKKQHKIMVIASRDPEFARKVGIPQEVAKEYVEADERLGLWKREETKSKSEKKKK